ncbi:MAG TPA: DUF4974 domain-containing protein [Bacteroidales bacterium]|nr:DUF4974 domain-containing protein [Bacteroidales bacterium]HOK73511.1 DUF4974 domain-containing protein [Bacteroidales bacterium]HOM39831.1 DUF4974 domain-containing protein [Bacteroidales bacterium]HPP91387.1 DUF4974 domain-containing protein [Bacteroidales bacterium]HRR16484.1 DUF4974 domain-containing protein [Bacteroidales bacterium]
MKEEKVDFDKLKDFFEGRNNDFEYIKKVFCDREKEDELKKVLWRQWYEILKEDIESEKDLSHILYRIHYEINSRKEFIDRRGKIHNILRAFTRIAAVLFIPLLIYSGYQFIRSSGTGIAMSVEITAPAWARVQFTLPDGTRGWLNNRSVLKYEAGINFNREVILDGEAYFDVAKEKRKQFRVKTDEVIITALGTKFNVASYNNEKNVEVVLEEGSLILTDKDNRYTCQMKPSELVIYDKTSGHLSKDTVQTNKYTSWKEGRLVFRNDPIDVIARRLERWYNIEVELKDIFPDDIRLRATFIDEDLYEVLEILKRSLNIDYHINERSLGDDGVFYKKKVILMSKKDI